MRAAACALVVLAASGCLSLREGDSTPRDNRCTACHGSAQAEGDAVLRAAPPTDTRGNTDVSAPGVGAHQLHLRASATHGPVACAECHVVPTRTDAPGHNDSDGPAEVTFGALAALRAGAPAYDATRRRCSDVYCHGYAETSPWTQPRDEDQRCGSCHGVPPPSPHPQSAACHACHGDVIAADGTFTAPERHVDGRVDVGALRCNTCHGDDESAAPPVSLDGGQTSDHLGVGAHTVHLRGTSSSRAVGCAECHVVPAKVAQAGHIDGVVDVVFSGAALGPSGVAGAWSSQARTCTAWCHQAGDATAHSPEWTSQGGPLGCEGCHAMPPPAPHPGWGRCSACHDNAEATDGGQAIIDAALHVNGVVEASPPASCNACHGSDDNPAPPRDVNGRTDTALPSVGAHQAHLQGMGPHRPVECADCHVVPAQTIAPGHADGVADVVFSGPAVAGVALSGGPAPSYEARTCANVTCHDPKPLVANHSAGGTDSQPDWTRLDGSQRTCRSCHGFPPPAPHPQNADCGQCHQNYVSGQFVRPDLHVDGKLTFTLP